MAVGHVSQIADNRRTSKSQSGHFNIGGRIRRRRKKRWRNETDQFWRTAGWSRKDQLK